MFDCSPQKYWDVHDTQLQSSCSPSPCTTQTRTGSVAAGLEIILNPIFFVQLPTPGQHREYSSDKRRFRGSIKAEIRRFFCKETYQRPAFRGRGMPRQPEPHKILSRIGSFLISDPARPGIGTSGRVTAGSSRCNLMRAGAAVFAVDYCLTVAKDVPTVEGVSEGDRYHGQHGMRQRQRQQTLVAGLRRAWLARCAAGLAAVSIGAAAAQTPATPSDAEVCLAANQSLSLGASLPRTTARLNAGATLRIVAIGS